MDEHELHETGKAICHPDSKPNRTIPDEVLAHVAKACHSYFQRQPIQHFHGLRDYYYLLKFLCDHKLVEEANKLTVIREGILRNFNGNKISIDEVMKQFTKVFPDIGKPQFDLQTESDESVIESLINKNLSDPLARHLMLIYESEGCLDLLCHMLAQQKRAFNVMYGSQYEKDQYSEEFTYRKLNEVMMCMEQGMVLILKDFDLIYGSLYDMLNQNYSEYAGRKYCRVAMGVQANQNCVVHRSFRCIVLVSKREVRSLDPPFLNRFEKQVFDFEDKLKTMKLTEAKAGVNEQLKQLCRVTSNDATETFKLPEVIQGFSEDLVAGYLIKQNRIGMEKHQAARELLPLLYRHMFPDAVLRTAITEENIRMKAKYFSSSLVASLESALASVQPHSGTKISKVFVYTKFSLYHDIDKNLGKLEDYEMKEIRLMDFSCECDLLDCFVPFFKNRSKKAVFIVRVKPSIDEQHIPYIRCLLDSLVERHVVDNVGHKILVIVAHLQHEDLELSRHPWKWNPLMDWKMFCVESLNGTRR